MRQYCLRPLVVGGMIFSLAGAATMTRADDSGVRKAIQTQYDRWSAAYIKNDVPTLLSILSSDFTLQTGSGKTLTRQQYEAILNKRKPKTPEQMSYTLVIERFKIRGNMATLYTRETQSETDTAAQTQTAPPEKHIHEYLDRWVKSGASLAASIQPNVKGSKGGHKANDKEHAGKDKQKLNGQVNHLRGAKKRFALRLCRTSISRGLQSRNTRLWLSCSSCAAIRLIVAGWQAGTALCGRGIGRDGPVPSASIWRVRRNRCSWNRPDAGCT